MSPHMRVSKRLDRVKVRELLEQGLSNLEIADRLGCAPNSITQIKRELGFPVQPWKGDRPKKAAREKSQKNGARKGCAASSAKARLEQPLPPPRVVEMPPVRHKGSCKWPLDGVSYAECGAPAVMGKPYCEAHCQRAYVGKSAGQGMQLQRQWIGR